MKKRFLIPLIILGMGAVGTAAGFSVNAYYQNKANETAQLIEVQENIQGDETLTEEEKSKLQIVIEQLTAKYNEIKDIQVAGTTIGAIAGAVVGAIVSMIPALLNRSNIKQAISTVALTKEIVDSNTELAENVKKDFNITNENYNKVISSMKDISAELEKTKNLLVKVSEENTVIKTENEELKDILLNIVNHSKELVANGVAEAINKKYLHK